MSKSILDPSFKYTDSASTDIGKRFKAIEAERRRVARVCADCEPWFDDSAFRPSLVMPERPRIQRVR